MAKRMQLIPHYPEYRLEVFFSTFPEETIMNLMTLTTELS